MALDPSEPNNLQSGGDLSDEELYSRLHAVGAVDSPVPPPSDPTSAAATAPAALQLPALPPPPGDTTAPVQAITPALTQPTAAPASSGMDTSSSAPAAPAQPSTDSSASDIQALLAGGSSDDAADDARSQYASDQKANLKLFKSQGGQTTITPTGAEVPATDAQGNQQYKPTTLSPVTQLPDGRFYRVDRDSTGNQKYFDLEDEGAEGSDYHVNPDTGEKWVATPTGNGGSRQTVIGMDGTVPAVNDLRTLLTQHQADQSQADLAISQAQNGVAGAPGYSSTPLATLQKQRDAVGDELDRAQDYQDSVTAYIRGGGQLTAPQLDTLKTAQAALTQHGPTAQALDGEISARTGVIEQARQQRDGLTSDANDTKRALATVFNAQNGGSTLSNDLTAAAQGQSLPPARASWYTKAGLLAPQQQADGSTSYQVTARGTSLLGRDAQQQIAAAPDSFALSDDARQALPKQSVPVLTASFNGAPVQADGTYAPPMREAGLRGPANDVDDPAQPLPVRIGRIRQNTLDQHRAILSEFPNVGQPGSAANLKFIRAFQATGSDPRKALQVARAVFGSN